MDALNKVYEYVVCDLAEDNDLLEIKIRSELLATDHNDAMVKVGVRLGQAGIDPDTVKVLIRPFG